MQLILDSTNKLVKEVQELKSSLQYSQKEIDDLKVANSINTSAVTSMSTKHDELKEALANLALKADYIENQSKRNNIVIDGIPDVPTESWDESQHKAKELLADHLKMDPKLVEIERAHQMGKYTVNGQPRPVIVKLMCYKDKEEILKQAKKLKGTNFFINEEFSERVRQRRKELLPQLRETRKQGNFAFLKYDQLIVHHPRKFSNEPLE